MSLLAILIILLLLVGFPGMPYNRAYGPAPAGIVWVILWLFLLMALLGGVHGCKESGDPTLRGTPTAVPATPVR